MHSFILANFIVWSEFLANQGFMYSFILAKFCIVGLYMNSYEHSPLYSCWTFLSFHILNILLSTLAEHFIISYSEHSSLYSCWTFVSFHILNILLSTLAEHLYHFIFWTFSFLLLLNILLLFSLNILLYTLTEHLSILNIVTCCKQSALAQFTLWHSQFAHCRTHNSPTGSLCILSGMFSTESLEPGRERDSRSSLDRRNVS